MQDCGAWVFAEGVEDSGERELAAVPCAKPPADNLAGFEVEHDCEVVLFALEAEVGEVLHPGTGIRHVLVALPGSRPCFVTEYREAFQGIRCGRYLC